MKRRNLFSAICAVLLASTTIWAAEPELDTGRADRTVGEYFRAETARLREACLGGVDSLEQWEARRAGYRGELLEMLGLDPLPERTDLKATVTGRVQGEGFSVENLHFQSRPGLYVTANLYLPEEPKQGAPAVLYVCGHGRVKQDGVSYGNKVSYQHHGCWFARHGYVCLTIDTLQLGEIEGIHHGTYREKMWWWNNRGYGSAGVEAWNCVRALDYLQSREEVDPERIGVTGRSGGGAYSWWIAAIDERIKVAVPVAGITDLENHVVDGCVEGHCDCMYFVNTYGWDYPLVAALVAPRPLLIGNSDNDGIFPLDGVTRTYEKARSIYALYGAGEQIGLKITEGPHKDTPELQEAAFAWFDKYLKGEAGPIDEATLKTFEPAELKVFEELPEDELNTTIQETFSRLAEPPAVPASEREWKRIRSGWKQALREKCFRGWPKKPGGLNVKKTGTVEQGGRVIESYEFRSQGPVRLPLYVVRPEGQEPCDEVTLNVLDEEGWSGFQAAVNGGFPAGEQTAAYFAPRGVGPTSWGPEERKHTQIRRRYMLLGQTLDGMRVWDVCRAIRSLRSLAAIEDAKLTVRAEGVTAGVALYASLFEPKVARLELTDLPADHREGPILLNVRRYLDMPQAVAMAAERSRVIILNADDTLWNYPISVADRLGWEKNRLEVRPGDLGNTRGR